MFKRKKEKRVVDLALQHVDTTGECLDAMASAVTAFVSGNHEDLATAATRVNSLEGDADNLLRDIRELLYSGAYLPLIRGDVYQLMSAVDDVANKAEECFDFVYCQKPRIAKKYKAGIIEIVDLTRGCFDQFRKALKIFYEDKRKTSNLRDHTRKVSKQESRVDENQRALLVQVFDSDMPIGDKLHLSQLIAKLGRISDVIEDAAEELELVNLKSIV